MPSQPARDSTVSMAARGRRASLVFASGLSVVAAALAVGVAVVSPGGFGWVAVGVLIGAVAVVDVLALRGRTWIEDGRLYERRVRTRQADLRRCATLQLRCAGDLEVHLVVRDDDGGCACASLLSLAPTAVHSASAVALELLATELAHARAPGAATVSGLLAQQAGHVASGRRLQDSPMSPFARCRPACAIDADGLEAP